MLERGKNLRDLRKIEVRHPSQMPQRRRIVPPKRESLSLPFERLIAVANRETMDDAIDELSPQNHWQQAINPGEAMRFVGGISRPQFISPIAAEHNFYVPRREPREYVRRQDRGIGHRLIETRQRVIEVR